MDLSFTIFVDSSESEEFLLVLLVDRLTGAVRDRGYLRVGCNVMKFEKNLDYDEGQRDQTDAWLHFRYCLDVFPVEATSLKDQTEVAAQLMDVIEASGARGYLASDFTD